MDEMMYLYELRARAARQLRVSPEDPSLVEAPEHRGVKEFWVYGEEGSTVVAFRHTRSIGWEQVEKGNIEGDVVNHNGKVLRPATAYERRVSISAAHRYGGCGWITIDGQRCYVRGM